MTSIEKEKKVSREIKVIGMLTLASLITAFNLSSFIDAGGLVPGGFSGITVLIQRIFQKFFAISIPFSAIYLPLNIIPTVIGFKYIGKRFTIYSLYVVGLSSLLTDIFPQFTVTYDILLITVFGGLISGVAAVLCLLAGASSGGTDIISIFFSERKGIDTWNYIFIGNCVLLATAGVLFGFDKALYSIIYQYVITQVLNTLYKRYQKDTLFIITSEPEKVYMLIRDMTNHDATRLEGRGCYEGGEKQILYSVIGRDEVDKVVSAIKKVDSKAFINVLRTDKLKGEFYRKPTK